MSHSSAHFDGKSVDKHILEKFFQGVNLSHEPHGIEQSGAWISFADSARTCAFILALWPAYGLLNPYLLFFIGLTLSLATAARGAWISWSRLERFHRMLNEERKEIDENREQERLELKSLYSLKGFNEPLLSQVTDVLMADSDRLLKVMLEEELGLRLGGHDHPLKIAFFCFLGTMSATATFLFTLWLMPAFSYVWASLLCGLSASLCAHTMANIKLHAFIWNMCGCWVLLIIVKQLFSLV